MNEQSNYQNELEKDINDAEEMQEKKENVQLESESVLDEDFERPLTRSEAKAILEDLKKRKKQWEEENGTYISEQRTERLYSYKDEDPFTRGLKK